MQRVSVQQINKSAAQHHSYQLAGFRIRIPGNGARATCAFILADRLTRFR